MKINDKEQIDYIRRGVIRSIEHMKQDPIDDATIDCIMNDSPFFKKNYIDVQFDKVSGLSDDEIDKHNEKVIDAVYNQIADMLEEYGFTARYDERKDKYFFDRREKKEEDYDIGM